MYILVQYYRNQSIKKFLSKLAIMNIEKLLTVLWNEDENKRINVLVLHFQVIIPLLLILEDRIGGN